MTNSTNFADRIVRCRMAGIAMLLSTAAAVGVGAQQETGGSAGQRSTGTPCPPMQVNGRNYHRVGVMPKTDDQRSETRPSTRRKP